jgi:class 3 adenylate cyclase
MDAQDCLAGIDDGEPHGKRDEPRVAARARRRQVIRAGLMGRGRGGDGPRSQGASRRRAANRGGLRRPHRQDDRRWALAGVSLRRRRCRKRDCDPEADGRAERWAPEPKRILYRIGVNLGDVLIEDDDILGDGVNVAARLEQIAEHGGVCLSGSAYDHVRGRVEAKFADIGEQRLKNIAEPVRAYSPSAEARWV